MKRWIIATIAAGLLVAATASTALASGPPRVVACEVDPVRLGFFLVTLDHDGTIIGPLSIREKAALGSKVASAPDQAKSC